ncbi:MAG: hypothetical protein IPP48_14375 [Chitinophagaceae bacterium]|nr:hypothetical protein [Chitinophagaceae bacterium]
MKKVFGLVIVIHCFLGAYSQNLEGEWVGKFIDTGSVNKGQYECKLIFVKQSNSGFQGYSITYFKVNNEIDSIICKLEYINNIGKTSWFFDEREILRDPNNRQIVHCFQFIHFGIFKKKKKYFLHSRFDSDYTNCAYGVINLTRVN